MENKIGKALDERDIKDSFLARELRVSTMTVWRWRHNKVQPNSKYLVEISNIIECSISDLV